MELTEKDLILGPLLIIITLVLIVVLGGPQGDQFPANLERITSWLDSVFVQQTLFGFSLWLVILVAFTAWLVGFLAVRAFLIRRIVWREYAKVLREHQARRKVSDEELEEIQNEVMWHASGYRGLEEVNWKAALWPFLPIIWTITALASVGVPIPRRETTWVATTSILILALLIAALFLVRILGLAQ